MDSVQQYELTIQRVLYGWILLSVPLIILSQFYKYQELTGQLRVLIRTGSVAVIGLWTLFLFQRAQSYFAIDTAPLQNDAECETQLAFVRWQKDRHKLERDMYLATCAIICCICLILIPHWMHKYYTYIDYKNQEIELEKKNKGKKD